MVAIAWVGATSAPAARPDASVAGPAASSGRVAAADAWLRLDSPARQDEVVRTGAIVVRGEVGPGVSEVWIGLESRTGKILVSRTVERTARQRTGSMAFERQFRLASARATGRLFVSATAIGADGVPIRSVRRRIEAAETVTTDAPVRHLVVRGWVARTVRDLRLMVTSSTRQPLATAAIDPLGGPRNGMVPFEATFRIPGVSADERLFVVPTDAMGHPRHAGAGLPIDGSVATLVVR